MYQNPNSNTYLENSVNTASPAKLVEMLYKNAHERLQRSLKLIDDKSIAEVNFELKRVQDIINELNVSLNMEVGGDRKSTR